MTPSGDDSTSRSTSHHSAQELDGPRRRSVPFLDFHTHMGEEKGPRVSMESGSRSELSSMSEEDHELLTKAERDLDEQERDAPTQDPDSATPVEYTTSNTKKLVYLALYFVLNLSVTLSNKALLRTVSTPFTTLALNIAS